MRFFTLQTVAAVVFLGVANAEKRDLSAIESGICKLLPFCDVTSTLTSTSTVTATPPAVTSTTTGTVVQTSTVVTTVTTCVSTTSSSSSTITSSPTSSTTATTSSTVNTLTSFTCTPTNTYSVPACCASITMALGHTYAAASGCTFTTGSVGACPTSGVAGVCCDENGSANGTCDQGVPQ